MKITIMAFVSCIGMSSCVLDQYEATSASGNRVKETFIAPGGTGSIKRSDGSSLVYDNQTSFRDFTNTITTVSGSLAVASVSKAKSASDAVTAQQGQKQAAKLASQKETDAAAAQAASDGQKRLDSLLKAGVVKPKP